MVEAPPRPASATVGFAHVRALGPQGADAAQRLTELHGRLLSNRAPDDAAQLIAVDIAAQRKNFEQLERILANGFGLSQLMEQEHAKVRKVAGWRNAVALLPLMVTWLALGFASWFYTQEVGRDPSLTPQPFLVLWQHRFEGAPVLTFAESAGISFGLLSVVLILTVWAHRLETRANRETATVGDLADKALNALSLAVDTSTFQPPETAREWAQAAQLVVTETQSMIQQAAEQTRRLAETNTQTTQEAAAHLARLQAQGEAVLTRLNTQSQDWLAELQKQSQVFLAQLQQQAQEWLAGVGQETAAVMVALRRESEQTTSRIGQEAAQVLQQAGESNRQLMEDQMQPLFRGFSESLAEYRGDQQAYRTSVLSLVSGVEGLTAAATELGGQAGQYSEVARSIDAQLKVIGGSQTEFVERVTENSKDMTTAATALRDVTELITGEMRADLMQITQNVVDASSRIADVDRDLVATTTALTETAQAMRTSARDLASTFGAAASSATAASTAATAASTTAANAATSAEAAAEAARAAATAATQTAAVASAAMAGLAPTPARGPFSWLLGR